jgi:large subunit ribosomal protein L10
MRQDKQLLLDEIAGQINKYPSFVLMQYLGLNANKANAFRRDVLNMGGDVAMMRKRVLIKAAETSGIHFDLASLPGHIGLVYAGHDPIEMTKYVFKFGQENDKTVTVVGGRLDGILYNAADVEMLSKLPGKNEMRAELLGILEAPLAQTLAVMDALISSVVYCLDNKCQLDQKG